MKNASFQPLSPEPASPSTPPADETRRAALPGLPPPAASAPLPPDDELPDAFRLRQLLRAALPDKSAHKAQGWFGSTDFLLTRAHVDEDSDTYHDGLFLTVWRQWDFWLADAPAPTHASLLQALAAQAGTWLLRRPAARGGFVQLYRRHGPAASAGAGDWMPLPSMPQAGEAAGHADDEEATAALAAFREAWRDLIGYWRLALAQRQAHHPLRQRLLAEWTAERIELLALLPSFCAHAPERRTGALQGRWAGPLWIGTRPARPPGMQPGARRSGAPEGAALRLAWRTDADAREPHTGSAHSDDDGDAGDETGEAFACYQLTVEHTAAHGPHARLQITYAQRASDELLPLPPEAADHHRRLLQLLEQAEGQLLRWHAAEGPAGDASSGAGEPLMQRAMAWLCPPTLPAAEAEAAAGTPHGPWPALSHSWQAAGRARAARLRRGLPAGADPRAPHAARVLALARHIGLHGDGDAAADFHRRFAYAPDCYAEYAAACGRHVGPVIWLPDSGGLFAACVQAAPGQGTASWVQIATQGPPHCGPLEHAHDATSAPMAPTATAPGFSVAGDAQGLLHARDGDGRPLWHHRISTRAVTAVAVSPDGRTVVAGTAGGELVLLRKSGGPDPFADSSSRYAEAARWLFWEEDAGAGIRW